MKEQTQKNNFGNCIYCGLQECKHLSEEQTSERGWEKPFADKAHNGEFAVGGKVANVAFDKIHQFICEVEQAAILGERKRCVEILEAAKWKPIGDKLMDGLGDYLNVFIDDLTSLLEKEGV